MTRRSAASIVYNFNPRTRVECDGATEHQGRADMDFNPRTRVECDSDIYRVHSQSRQFQSTHSCRVRRIKDAYDEIKDRFQSTHSCRVRRTHSLKTILMSIFQSTHSCRVRLKVYQSVGSVCSDFNPRTRVECDQTAWCNGM